MGGAVPVRSPITDLAFRVATAFDSDALIAGGYVRDKLLGVEPRDVDVYLHVPHDDKRNVNARRGIGYLLRAHCGSKGRRLASAYEAEGYASAIPLLVGAAKFVTPLGYIDFLFTRHPVTPQRIFDSYDIGLCMVSLDASYTATADVRFGRDRADRTITSYPEQLHTDYQRVLHKEHLKKLQKKYPAFEVRQVGEMKYDAVVDEDIFT